MRVFIYEFLTGGGTWAKAGMEVAESLLAEGRAMIQAVSDDFTSLQNVEVITTHDVRLAELHPPACRIVPIASADEELAVIRRLAANVDWTIIIAPETGGVLRKRCKLVEAVGGRLLAPSSVVVEIAESKQKTAELLAHAGVATPRGSLVTSGVTADELNLKFPIVVKPMDGCGSQGLWTIRDESGFNGFQWPQGALLRAEEIVPGLPASVAILCGPEGNHALPACEQRMSTDGKFTYLGGRLPLETRLDVRAKRLALAAVAALPHPLGYVGVDLVLGEALDGSGDQVIEINPRLTTSYVGLRKSAHGSLAAAMLAVANGQRPELSFSGEPVEFTRDGRIL